VDVSKERVVPVLAKLALLKDSPVELTMQYGVCIGGCGSLNKR
jgi:hypothetical protein